MTRLVIVANGNLDKTFLSEIRKVDYIIGVDRGAYWLIVNGIIPDIAIGDFDSVSANEFQIIKQKIKQVEKYPKEKDFSDTELAVKHAISLHPKEVVIYGAIGSRFDHTMANVYLLEKFFNAGIKGIIRDKYNEIMLISSRTILNRGEGHMYISILPLTDNVEITLTGFAYDVSRVRIHRGQTRGVSNEIQTKQAIIELYHGTALLIKSRD